MAELTAGKGCLAEKPDGVPNFHLSTAQRESIGKALAGIECRCRIDSKFSTR